LIDTGSEPSLQIYAVLDEVLDISTQTRIRETDGIAAALNSGTSDVSGVVRMSAEGVFEDQ
jgi:hypothetical protein